MLSVGRMGVGQEDYYLAGEHAAYCTELHYYIARPA